MSCLHVVYTIFAAPGSDLFSTHPEIESANKNAKLTPDLGPRLD